MWAREHRREHSLYVRKRDVVMKQIAHRIDEYDPWLSPLARHVYEIGVECYLETIPIALSAHGSKPVGHTLCVAVFAALADLGATSYRIPSHFSPLNV